MDPTKGTPFVAEVLGAIADRRQAEAGKLGALLALNQKLDAVLEELGAIRRELEERNERERTR